MNIRKNIDYSAMFAALDAALNAELPQMKLCCELGRIVCSRPEKGAAVAAAEHLHSRFPDASGFSPRNLRRMREFYRMYEDTPELLALAMEISWTLAGPGHGDQLDPECSHFGSRHGAGGTALVSSCRWSFWLVKGGTPEKNRF